jgi:hypothetical protein
MRKFIKKIIVKYLGGTFLEAINFFKFTFKFIYLFSVLVSIAIFVNLYFNLKNLKEKEVLAIILLFTLILLLILIAFTADYYLNKFKDWIIEAKVNDDKILPLSDKILPLSRDIILLNLISKAMEEAGEKKEEINKEEIILNSFSYEIDPAIEDNQMDLVNDLYKEMHDIVIKRDTLKDLYSIYQKLN